MFHLSVAIVEHWLFATISASSSPIKSYWLFNSKKCSICLVWMCWINPCRFRSFTAHFGHVLGNCPAARSSSTSGLYCRWDDSRWVIRLISSNFPLLQTGHRSSGKFMIFVVFSTFWEVFGSHIQNPIVLCSSTFSVSAPYARNLRIKSVFLGTRRMILHLGQIIWTPGNGMSIVTCINQSSKSANFRNPKDSILMYAGHFWLYGDVPSSLATAPAS